MRVRVLFFAAARESAGREAMELALPAGSTVREAREAIAGELPGLRARLPHLLIAVDEEYARPETPLRDGAEVAVIPPVSGG